MPAELKFPREISQLNNLPKAKKEFPTGEVPAQVLQQTSPKSLSRTGILPVPQELWQMSNIECFNLQAKVVTRSQSKLMCSLRWVGPVTALRLRWGTA